MKKLNKDELAKLKADIVKILEDFFAKDFNFECTSAAIDWMNNLATYYVKCIKDFDENIDDAEIVETLTSIGDYDSEIRWPSDSEATKIIGSNDNFDGILEEFGGELSDSPRDKFKARISWSISDIINEICERCDYLDLEYC